MEPNREFLRHALATLAYRGAKAVGGAPDGFGRQRVCATGRPAGEILSHMGDLLEWALVMAQGQTEYKPAAPQAWEAEVERFFAGLRRLDDCLAGDAPLCAAAIVEFD